MSKIKKRYSSNKELQISHLFVEEYNTTDEFIAIAYGGPDDITDIDVGTIAFLNLGENPADYRIYEDYVVEDREVQRSDSKMLLTSSGTIPAGAPPVNQVIELLLNSPAHIKLYVRSTVAGQPTVLDVQLKTRG